MFLVGDAKTCVQVLIVCGPNFRTDYHIQNGEEFFYQLKGIVFSFELYATQMLLLGDITLKIVEDGNFYDVPIREGQVFCLPGKIPHSPQRGIDSIGLVIERKREETELDELRWYCDRCRRILYQETFFCDDLVLDLPPIIEKYYSSESLRTCKNCGWIEEPPKYDTADVKSPSSQQEETWERQTECHADTHTSM